VIIDISQPLSPGMAMFPGDTPYIEGATFKIGPNCPVNVASVSLSAHCGSHADAPLHYDENGAPIGALDLEPFIGPCRVIDARGETALCGPRTIDARLGNAPPRILLRLAECGDPHVWPRGFRAVAAETMELLASRGVKLIGIDTPSLDPETSKDLPAHMAAKRADIRILENLVLAHVEPGDYELIALPLRFANLDASPVRAVLRRR
jgi:arylformamidase